MVKAYTPPGYGHTLVLDMNEVNVSVRRFFNLVIFCMTFTKDKDVVLDLP